MGVVSGFVTPVLVGVEAGGERLAGVVGVGG